MCNILVVRFACGLGAPILSCGVGFVYSMGFRFLDRVSFRYKLKKRLKLNRLCSFFFVIMFACLVELLFSGWFDANEMIGCHALFYQPKNCRVNVAVPKELIL